MKFPHTPPPTLVAAAICVAMVAVTGSCRKPGVEGTAKPTREVILAPELSGNQLAGLPGAVYQSQVSSPIRWQPWSKATLERAKNAGRLLFVVVATPQQPGFQGVLASLASNPETVAEINFGYVPVLVDGDASREMGILTADLCAEIKRPLQLPLFIWMTHEGNPVAWIPVAATDANSVRETFEQSNNMISRTWRDNPEYVLTNSAMDNANRRGRIEQRKVAKVMSEQPATDVVRSVRQLASLYDPYTRSFDETGGLFPCSSLELLSVASQRPGLPENLRARCLATVKELLTDLLPSPVFDPLDGGAFSSRRGTSWTLPSFTRDCPSQARIVVSLIEAHRATGDGLALERALSLIGFVEKSYATPDGLFAVGMSPETKPEQWMWSVEEVRSILTPEEADWWIGKTAMNGLGNLASELDPRRDYFRKNTLGLSRGIAAYARERDQSEDEFRRFFDASRGKLLDARNRRMGVGTRDNAPHAGASLRMASAYASAFAITGDETYRTKAVKLLERCRESFAVGPHLRTFATGADPAIGDGRAFLYALALQAVLDVAAITSDEKWYVWSEDLATTAAELFTGNGFLKECPDEARLIDIPVTDLVMLFDDSTAGLISMAESRLAELDRPLVASFSELATPLPSYCLDRPVLHTDLILATVCRHLRLTVLIGTDVPADLKLAVERLPVRTIPRRIAPVDSLVPVGSVKLLLPDDRSVVISSPEELRATITTVIPDAAR